MFVTVTFDILKNSNLLHASATVTVGFSMNCKYDQLSIT